MIRTNKKLNIANFINKFEAFFIQKGKKKKVKFSISSFYYFKKFFTRRKRVMKHIFLLLLYIYRLRPSLNVKWAKKGSKVYHVPNPFVNKNASLQAALRLFKLMTTLRREYLFWSRFRQVIRDVSKKKSIGVKAIRLRKKMSSANIFHLQYRW